MALLDTFSRRKRLATQKAEPFSFTLPGDTRMAIVHTWRDAGAARQVHSPAAPFYEVHRLLLKAHKIPSMGYVPTDSVFSDHAAEVELAVAKYFLSLTDTDRALDVVEVAFRAIESYMARVPNFVPLQQMGVRLTPDEAIAELNETLLEDATGFQYENGRIIQLDSKFLHLETVKPAISLLIGNGFEGAEHEFMTAHKHYRNGEYEDAVSWSCKAFESTMKTICERRNWSYDKDRDTAGKLVKIILANGLLPGYSEEGLTGLRILLESGLPTVRNRSGGHGSGSDRREVPQHVAAFAIHMAASYMLLMVEAFAAKRP